MFRFVKNLFNHTDDNSRLIADVSIAGLQHYRGNDLAEMFKKGDRLKLQQQPDNPHDSNAIVILWHENKIGYLPRSLASNISRQLNQGITIKAYILDIKPVRFGRKWIKIRLETT